MLYFLRTIWADTKDEAGALAHGRTASPVRPDGAGAPRIRPADLFLAVVLLALAAILYGSLGLRLARGQYLDYWNLAFDFDAARTVQTIAGSPPDFQGFKHPLVVLLRPLAWPFLGLGMTAKQASALVMAEFGAGSVALCFLFLRACTIDRTIAAALALLFMVTGTQIFTSMIVETYAVAGFSLVLVWLLARLRQDDPDRLRRSRQFATLLVTGTTITNIVQVFIAEFLLVWRRMGFRRAVTRCIGFAVVFALLILTAVLLVWHNPLREALHDPVHALKLIYWEQTKGPKVGIGHVLLIFFTLSFVSPNYTWLMLPEGINMRDFRDYAFAFPGQIAAPFWLAFWAAGAVGAFLHRGYRPIAISIGCALAFNVLFHLNFQFRGSLYIYAAHVHFLIFALGAGLAPWLRSTTAAGRAYIATVLLLAVLVGADNLAIARAFVADFDQVNVPCKAPCDGT